MGQVENGNKIYFNVKGKQNASQHSVGDPAYIIKSVKRTITDRPAVVLKRLHEALQKRRNMLAEAIGVHLAAQLGNTGARGLTNGVVVCLALCQVEVHLKKERNPDDVSVGSLAEANVRTLSSTPKDPHRFIDVALNNFTAVISE